MYLYLTKIASLDAFLLEVISQINVIVTFLIILALFILPNYDCLWSFDVFSCSYGINDADVVASLLSAMYARQEQDGLSVYFLG